MANEIRVRADSVAGALSAGLGTGDTSMSSGGLADLPAIGSTEHAAITLFTTDSDGRVTKKEIVYVTAHTGSATTATIGRAKEGTTAQTWSTGDKWVHGPTVEDHLTHAYIGRTTVGGTFEAMVANKNYCKKVSLTRAGLLASVGAHLRHNTTAGAVVSFHTAVYADSGNDPSTLLGWGGQQTANSVLLTATLTTAGSGQWIQMPIGLWLPAGDYWMAVGATDVSSGLEIAMDTTGGTDVTFTTGGAWWANATNYTRTVTDDNYSIRGSLVTG